jgi:uncharacterized phiE125 gp8 family phage protein
VVSLILITAPTQDVVTLDEAKAQLRLTDNSLDDVVGAIVDACVNQLDPAGGGWLGRALRPQTWEYRLDCFPSGRIELPYPPLISITSLKYDTTAGVETTLVEDTDFRVMDEGGLYRQAVAPLYNGYWPIARDDEGSVRIRFQSGYDGEADPDPLPAAIKQAIHLAVRNIHALTSRDVFVSSKDVAGVSTTGWFAGETANRIVREAAETLLSTYRVW